MKKKLVNYMINKQLLITPQIIEKIQNKTNEELNQIFENIQNKTKQQIKEIFIPEIQQNNQIPNPLSTKKEGNVSMVFNYTSKDVNKTISDFISYFNIIDTSQFIYFQF